MSDFLNQIQSDEINEPTHADWQSVQENCDWCGEAIKPVQPECSCCIDESRGVHGQDTDEDYDRWKDSRVFGGIFTY